MSLRFPVSGLVWLCGFFLTGHCFGQVPEFRAQSGLLSGAGLPSPPFRSGTPMGVADLNGDGRDDIVRVGAGSRGIPDQLSIEIQTSPGAAFRHLFLGQISEEWAASLCVADVDGNGTNDFLLAGYDISGGNGEGSLVLYRGDADGTIWSMDATPVRDGQLITQGTIFADIDNDGGVDILACDDLDNPEKFLNDGQGNFTWDTSDMAFPTSLPWSNSTAPNPNEGNYSFVAADIDNDGDVDYYLSKCRLGDGDPSSLRRINRLFENDGTGGFAELAGARGLADGNQSWCANFGDIDNDGDLDCFVLNHQISSAQPSGPSGQSILFSNDGSGNFSDSTAAAGLSGAYFIGIQSLFRDFNNDGFLDLLITNMPSFPPDYGFYLNDGDGTFTGYGPQDGVFKDSSGVALDRLHSIAVGDLNHDGFLDVYAGMGNGINYPGSTGEPDHLCLNQSIQAGNTNGYLSVTLAGTQSNPNGIGARIEAHGPWAVGGGQGVQVREIHGGEGYGIMNSLNAHFGLGTSDGVDQLVVRWPSGAMDTIHDVPGDRCVTVFEGTSAVAMEYADWIADFYPAGGVVAEADADPDKDGTKNILEQLLGRNPKMPDAGNELEAALIREGNQDYLVVTVERVPTRNTRAAIEFSSNPGAPGDWLIDPAAEVLEDSPTCLTVRLPVDSALQKQMFARLSAILGR